MPFREYWDREPGYYLHELKDAVYQNGPDNVQIPASVMEAHEAHGKFVRSLEVEGHERR